MTNRENRTQRMPVRLCGLAVGLLLACAPSAPGPGVVATSDLGEVSLAELEQYILSLPESRRAPGAGLELGAWRESLLEELIVSRAAEAEASELGLDESEEGRAILAAQREHPARELEARPLPRSQLPVEPGERAVVAVGVVVAALGASQLVAVG